MRNFLLLLFAAAVLQACGAGGKTDDYLKVITYNIRLSAADDGENCWEHRKHATLKMIATAEPDLIGMQEVMSDQYDYLAENTGEHYGLVGAGRDDGVRSGEMMAVMYKKERFDKLDEGHFWLSETPDEVSHGWDGACNRMVTWLKLRDKRNGREIYLFNTHLDHRGEVARLEGSRLVAERIAAIAGNSAFALTGDFNALPDDPVLAPLKESFPSARDHAHVTDWKNTFNGFRDIPEPEINSKGDLVIDHIYYGGLEPLEFRTLDGDYGAPYISDHYPVEALFVYTH